VDASGRLQREAVQLLFKRFDTDGDGFVDTGQGALAH
jgi:Ca2+-binding EF-hand superfamily protein